MGEPGRIPGGFLRRSNGEDPQSPLGRDPRLSRAKRDPLVERRRKVRGKLGRGSEASEGNSEPHGQGRVETARHHKGVSGRSASLPLPPGPPEGTGRADDHRYRFQSYNGESVQPRDDSEVLPLLAPLPGPPRES